MAITNDQNLVLKIVAGLFNAAPGKSNFDALSSSLTSGSTPLQIAEALDSVPAFASTALGSATTTQAKVDALMNNFGLSVAGDLNPNSAASQAYAYFTQAINAGQSLGSIVHTAVTFLSGSVPAEFATTATLLSNKAAVAEHYSVTQGVSGATLADLQTILSGVTATTDVSTPAALDAVIAKVTDSTAPVATAATFSFAENATTATVLGTVTATDNAAVTGFEIVSGNDSKFFAIDSAGKITLTEAGTKSAANDFETTPNTFTIGVKAVDAAGNKSEAVNTILSVTDVDDVAPAFVGATAATGSNKVTVNFGEALKAGNPAATAFTVKDGTTTVGVTAAAVNGSAVTLTLASNVAGTITVSYDSANAVNKLQDAAGNLTANFDGKTASSDVTAPTLSTSTPSDGGTLGKADNIVLTFSEDVVLGSTGNITIVNSGDSKDTRTIAVNDAGQVTVSGTKVTINPTADLVESGAYYINIPSGAISDKAGNAYAGISDATTLNFTGAAATVTPVAGQTFTLTTSPDNIVGTANNDTINAYIDAAGTTDTLSAPDVIDGGAGTADALVITTDGAAAGALPAASISNVEVFSIREVGGTAGVYDFGTVTGETSIINRISTDALTLSNLAAGTSLTIKGDASSTNGATTFTMAAVTDAVALIIDGGYTGAANITRNQTGAATVTINSTGAANTVGTIDLDTGTLLTGLTIDATSNLTASLAADYAANSTLTGKGSAVIDLTGATLSTNITSVIGSTMTGGGLRVALGANTTSFVGGAGDDAVYVDALVIGSSKTVAAGAGTGDLIRLTDAAALTTTTAQYLTGFEILRLADDNDGALDTFDMSMLSGLTSLQLDADSAGDGYSITNMTAAQAGAVTIRGTQAVTPTFGVTGASTVGQIDTLGLTIDDGATTTSTITLANITASGVEKVTVAMNDHLTVSSLTGMTALTNLTFSATAKNLSVTSGALALNVNTAVDASAVTGTVTVDLSAATSNGASIKGSATAVNTLKGGVGADVIVGGTGVDTVTVANTGADTVDFVSDASADIYELASLSGRSTFTNFDSATTSTTEDLVNVTHDSIDGGEVSITTAAAQGAIVTDRTYVISQTVGTAAALTTGGTATLAAADYTATTLTNVATYLSERFTGDNDTLADEFAVIFLNNGTTTYAYTYSDSITANTTIDAGELALVGVFTGSILNAGDIYQTV